MKACLFNLEDNTCLIGTVFEQASWGCWSFFTRNCTLRLRISRSISQTSQFVFELGISIPSLRTRVSGGWSHPYRKDRWRFLFIFLVIQVEREIVMIAWRLHWGLRESGQCLVMCCLSLWFACLIYLLCLFTLLWCIILWLIYGIFFAFQ